MSSSNPTLGRCPRKGSTEDETARTAEAVATPPAPKVRLPETGHSQHQEHGHIALVTGLAVASGAGLVPGCVTELVTGFCCRTGLC